MSLAATTLLSRFLGGVEGSSFRLAKTFRTSGSVAVAAVATWFLNGELVEQNPIINPDPSSWVALDKNGKVTEIKVGREHYRKNAQSVSEFLREAT